MHKSSSTTKQAAHAYYAAFAARQRVAAAAGMHGASLDGTSLDGISPLFMQTAFKWDDPFAGYRQELSWHHASEQRSSGSFSPTASASPVILVLYTCVRERRCVRCIRCGFCIAFFSHQVRCSFAGSANLTHHLVDQACNACLIRHACALKLCSIFQDTVIHSLFIKSHVGLCYKPNQVS